MSVKGRVVGPSTIKLNPLEIKLNPLEEKLGRVIQDYEPRYATHMNRAR
jgi:hypothetical protein